jgi:hypothetical protein
MKKREIRPNCDVYQNHMEDSAMKKVLIVLVALFSALAFSNATNAAPIAFTLESYIVNVNNSDPGLVLQTANILSTPFNFSLNEGDSVTKNLFSIWTNEKDVGSDDKVHKNASVSFSFTAPSPSFGGTVEGETFGVYSGSWFFNTQYGKLEWDGVVEIPFGNLGLLNASLDAVKFNWGLYGLSEGYCWGADVPVTFTLEKAPSSVPEPATMLLLGLGLVGLAGLGRKKFN